MSFRNPKKTKSFALPFYFLRFRKTGKRNQENSRSPFVSSKWIKPREREREEREGNRREREREVR